MSDPVTETKSFFSKILPYLAAIIAVLGVLYALLANFGSTEVVAPAPVVVPAPVTEVVTPVPAETVVVTPAPETVLADPAVVPADK